MNDFDHSRGEVGIAGEVFSRVDSGFPGSHPPFLTDIIIRLIPAKEAFNCEGKQETVLLPLA